MRGHKLYSASAGPIKACAGPAQYIKFKNRETDGIWLFVESAQLIDEYESEILQILQKSN